MRINTFGVHISIGLLTILFVLMFAPVRAQVQSESSAMYSFTWLDKSGKELTALLRLELTQAEAEELFRLKFNVTWYDEASEPIGPAKSPPLLYLHKLYFRLDPGRNFKCITFEETSQTEIIFSDNSSLIIQVLGQRPSAMGIECSFFYGFSQTAINQGDMQRIRTAAGSSVRHTFSLPKPRQVRITEGQNTNTTPPSASSYTQNLEKKVLEFEIRFESFVNDRIDSRLVNILKDEWVDGPLPGTSQTMIDSVKRLAQDEVNRSRLILSDLASFIGELEVFRQTILKDSLDSGKFGNIQSSITRLIDQAGQKRSVFYSYRLDLETGSSIFTPVPDDNFADSVINEARNRYGLIFKRQNDSLQRLEIMHAWLGDEIKKYLDTPKGRLRNNPEVDSVFMLHEKLSEWISSLRDQHEQDWRRYRDQTFALSLIPEIEQVHSEFVKEADSLSNHVKNLDLRIAELTVKIDRPGILASEAFLYAGSVFLGLILIYFFVRRTFKRTIREVIPTATALPGENGQLKVSPSQPGSGVFDPVFLQEYYTIDYTQNIAESVIGKIHIHTGVIKSIYQIIQGALVKKNPDDLGAYLLGSYYRLQVGDQSKYELMIDKMVPSQAIRHNPTGSSLAKADLVDEMDEVMKLNKKFLLLGWLTATSDPTLGMSDLLVKMHRTFFREKWQIAVHVNPVSHDLQSAFFIRRKTGYFEPYPDPAAITKWDALYQYAVNPPFVSAVSQMPDEEALKNYNKLDFSKSWTDSMIRSIGFAPDLKQQINLAAQNHAILSDPYVVVGFLYGHFVESDAKNQRQGKQYDVIVQRFVEAQNGSAPREIPGLQLLGWWATGKTDLLDWLSQASQYHDKYFNDAYQVCCLHHLLTGELRIISRKQNRELNNSPVELEEFNISALG